MPLRVFQLNLASTIDAVPGFWSVMAAEPRWARPESGMAEFADWPVGVIAQCSDSDRSGWRICTGDPFRPYLTVECHP